MSPLARHKSTLITFPVAPPSRACATTMPLAFGIKTAPARFVSFFQILCVCIGVSRQHSCVCFGSLDTVTLTYLLAKSIQGIECTRTRCKRCVDFCFVAFHSSLFKQCLFDLL